MVAERVVLRGVEHLEQRGRGIAAEATGLQLVDLVDQQHRVHRARLGQRAHDATGPRPDVGTPVTADLGLVTHTTDGDAHERTAERARDRLTERRLADTRRTDEHEDRTGTASADAAESALAAQHAHREELEDALLHLVEAFVVGVEHRARLAEVAVLVGELAPRQLEHRVEPVADPRVLGVLLTHALEPVELLVDRGAHRVGQRQVGELGAVLRDGVVVALAELLADRVHLAAQQHLALLLVEVVAHLGADLVLQLEVGEHLARPRDRELEARLDVDRLEQLDALLHREVGRVRGRVGQRAGLVDTGEHVGDAARAAVLEHALDRRRGTRAPARGRARRRRARRRARPGRAARPRRPARRCRCGRGRCRG